MKIDFTIDELRLIRDIGQQAQLVPRGRVRTSLLKKVSQEISRAELVLELLSKGQSKRFNAEQAQHLLNHPYYVLSTMAIEGFAAHGRGAVLVADDLREARYLPAAEIPGNWEDAAREVQDSTDTQMVILYRGNAAHVCRELTADENKEQKEQEEQYNAWHRQHPVNESVGFADESVPF